MTQIRVHELASELNVSTQQVLGILEDLGKKVRGPSTVIGISAAAKVRGRFRCGRLPAGSAATVDAVSSDVEVTPVSETRAVTLVRATADPAVAGNEEPVAKVDVQLSAASVVEPITSLFLPPVAPVAARSGAASTAAFANPFAVPTTKPPRRPAPAAIAHNVPRPASNLVAAAPLVAEEEPDFDAEWERRGFAKDEQQEWLSGGLRAAEASLADRCRSAGIDPAELCRKLSGRTALQRLRDGEASTSVWARLREAEQQPRRTGTKLTGRFQLS